MRDFFRPGRWYRYPEFRGSRPYRRVDSVIWCPEKGEEILQSTCVDCPKYGVWEKGDCALCWYEYKQLKAQGHYAKDQEEWLGYLHELDHELWSRLVEEERNRKRVVEKMEAESAELKSQADHEDSEQDLETDPRDYPEVETEEEEPSEDTDEDEDDLPEENDEEEEESDEFDDWPDL